MRIFPVLLSLFLCLSCQSAPSLETSSNRSPKGDKITAFSLTKLGITGKLLSPGDWLGQDLDFAPYNDLRLQLEKDLGKTLKNRGEAHITIITPPEMKILTTKITAQDVSRLAANLDLGQADFEVICVGEGRKETFETYFVVVKSPRLLNFRKGIAKIAGSPAEFKPKEYYPHITLGFTERDLHIQDGVIKNEKSCRNSIVR